MEKANTTADTAHADIANHGNDDARIRLERLYREIGISAVASALHMSKLASVEDREAIARASHEIPPMMRKKNAAA